MAELHDLEVFYDNERLSAATLMATGGCREDAEGMPIFLPSPRG